MKEKFKKTKLYRGVAKLIGDLKPMTGKERLEHLWMYYKEWLIVVFLVFMGISLVTTVISEQNKDVMAAGMMVNLGISQEGMNYLTVDYAKALGATSKNQEARMDYTSFGDPLDPERGEESYYASMILPSRVSGAMLDYILLDKYAMQYYISQDVYLDLREFFTEDELQKFYEEDRLIFAREEESDDTWVVAVKINDIPFVKEHIRTPDDVYFALSGNTPDLEICRNMWNYLHSWAK